MAQTQHGYAIGVDAARNFQAICVLVPDGADVNRDEWECDNTPEGL